MMGNSSKRFRSPLRGRQSIPFAEQLPIDVLTATI
jgi:hypothetical protein